MAKAQENQTNVSGSGKKKDWKFYLIMILVLLLLLGAVGAGAYYIGMQMSSSSEQGSQDDGGGSEGSGFSFGSDKYLGPLVELEDFVVNISDGEQTRYLKTAITLETNNKKVKEEVTNRLPQVRDAIIFELSGKTFDQLRDLQGKKQLQAELVKNLNELLKKGRIVRLFFTEFVVQ